MREAAALVRAQWLSATSYRLGMVMSVASLAAIIVPVYFVANALQPMMQDSIQSQGGDYFAFVVVGLMAAQLVAVSLNALPNAIQSGIGTGTLEALLSTRVRLPVLLAGLIGYPFLWTGIRSVILLAAGLVLGMSLAWKGVPVAALLLVLTVAAHLPFGLVAGALVVAFRTTGPLPQAILLLSGLLGGVYYPTHVIPSWIQHISNALPLTYGLRAIRGTLLEGLPLHQVLDDVVILAAFAVGLALLCGWLFVVALRYARRAGTLAQY